MTDHSFSHANNRSSTQMSRIYSSQWL